MAYNRKSRARKLSLLIGILDDHRDIWNLIIFLHPKQFPVLSINPSRHVKKNVWYSQALEKHSQYSPLVWIWDSSFINCGSVFFVPTLASSITPSFSFLTRQRHKWQLTIKICPLCCWSEALPFYFFYNSQ